ncbi:E3 ubiquitin-protein ligase MPSR1-like [Syzygium oleosum]|uniref:E3 ubiquitin-protein ligase MPSR1-like n=1 Tax=Syzygium oleosum TaxID=219896 RepID=UPI0011D29DBE|nr:E3 ubiquitin-protein ligase MPSR1-like [Syzygium oleosum]
MVQFFDCSSIQSNTQTLWAQSTKYLPIFSSSPLPINSLTARMASSDAEPPPPEAPPRLQENQNQERGHNPRPRDRIILVNPLTQDTVVVDPSSPPPPSWEPLLRALRAGKGGGRPPASGESVRAMRDVIKRTSEGGREEEGEEEEEEECAICMEEFEEGREMPCGHRFHGGCIERWLGIHGTCPVCRYQMPVDEAAAARNRWEDDGEEGEGREQGRRDVWISFSVVRRDSSSLIVHHHHHHHLHHHY